MKPNYKGSDGDTFWRGQENPDGGFDIYVGPVGVPNHGHIKYDNKGRLVYHRLSNGDVLVDRSYDNENETKK